MKGAHSFYRSNHPVPAIAAYSKSNNSKGLQNVLISFRKLRHVTAPLSLK
jgi:hypothetical protein